MISAANHPPPSNGNEARTSGIGGYAILYLNCLCLFVFSHFIHSDPAAMKIFFVKTYARYLLLSLCCTVILTNSHAQATEDTVRKNDRLQVGVFMPLYLDSAFDPAGNYRYNKAIPGFLASGMDFYIGVQQAVDSLAKNKTAVDIHVFDSRDNDSKPEILTLGDTLKKMHLLAGIVNVNEAAVLARFAKANQIPFININLPNEAGSSANPFHIVTNATLATHCQAIYKYLQYNHALSQVLLITKKGTQEDRIRTYIEDAGATTASVPIKIKTLEIKDSLDAEELLPLLDSNKTTACVIGSLDLQFSMGVCAKLAQLTPNYPMLALGMPTWEQLNFAKPSLKGLEIVYPTSFYADPEEKKIRQLREDLFDRYFLRPKDITLRIYDFLYTFCQLTPNSGPFLLEKISQTQFMQLGQLNIQAVRNKNTGVTDYSENKKIYFVKKLNGATQAVE